MSDDHHRAPSPSPSIPSWRSVILVCGDCKKRGGRAPKVKTKAAIGEARRVAREQVPRMRVLKTNCLGLCPRKALAVACAGDSRPARITGVTTLTELRATLPMLVPSGA